MVDHSPLSVLVVEDDGDIAETLKDFLDDHGYSVSCIASGEAALQVLRAGRHTDIMLVDFTLSSMMTASSCSTSAEPMRRWHASPSS